MQRNSVTLFLESPNTITPVPWVDDAPDFSGFTEPTLSVLQKAWDDFEGELEVIPDPEPPAPPINWDGLVNAIAYDPNAYTLVTNWYNTCPPAASAPLMTAISAQNLGSVEQRLPQTIAAHPMDAPTYAELQQLLIDFDVPISLP